MPYYDERMFSPQDMVSEAGLSSLLRPIQVWIPSYVQRGSGFDVHFEFEVKVRHCMVCSISQNCAALHVSSLTE